MPSFNQFLQWLRDCLRPPNASPELLQEIRNRQIRAALQLIPVTSTANIVLALLGAWWYGHLAPWWVTVLWIAPLLLIEFDSLRSFALSQAPQRMVQCKDMRRTLWQSAVPAAVLGIGLAWVFPQVDADNRLLLGGIAMGLIGVGAFVVVSIPAAGLLWMGCLSLGTVIALLQVQGALYWVMLVLLVVYTVIMAMTLLTQSQLFVALILAKAQAAQHSRELEAFAYTVAHDLRGPIRHVQGFSEMLVQRSKASLDQESQRILDIIVRSAKRQGDLVDELLNYTRIGERTVQLQALDVGELIRDVRVQLLAEDATLSRVEWSIGAIPRVYADATLLRQALLNLLQNAIKYSQRAAPPKIDIFAAQSESGMVDVSVHDNGVGFDMQYKDKLFNVFQRLHADSEFPGTGIGLAIVRRAIEKQNGSVRAESAPGSGATFTFSLRQAAQ